jgi:dolichyldiphosphatase
MRCLWLVFFSKLLLSRGYISPVQRTTCGIVSLDGMTQQRKLFGSANGRVKYSGTRLSIASRAIRVASVPFNFVGESAKLLVSSSAGLSVLLSSSWLPLYYIFGALLNALLGKIIKRIVRQPRPPTSKKGGYGMPSSHAHLLFYFLTITTFLSRKHYSSYMSLILSLVLSGYAISASYWRVVDGLHSLLQTFVGAALGVAMGTLIHTRQTEILDYVLSPSTQHRPVPIMLKFLVLFMGGVTLYIKELKGLANSKARA